MNFVKKSLCTLFATVAVGLVSSNVAGHITAAKLDDKSFSGIQYGENDTHIPEATATMVGMTTSGAAGLILGAWYFGTKRKEEKAPALKP